MFDFHQSKKVYFNYQYLTCRDYIIPFISRYIDLGSQKRVLEIGSAEAGVLKAFTEQGHQCVGIELSEKRVALAKEFMATELASNQVEFIAEDIYNIDPNTRFEGPFDIIILKDVIEHIHDQGRFMARLASFMAPDGIVFFGFPPWQMPFGGHQQIASHSIASKLPYYHLLPKGMYKGMLKAFGENERTIENLLEIKDTGISIERFEKELKSNNFEVLQRKLFLINPIYKHKFNLKVREQLPLLGQIPYLRNFFSTCAYYVLGSLD